MQVIIETVVGTLIVAGILAATRQGWRYMSDLRQQNEALTRQVVQLNEQVRQHTASHDAGTTSGVSPEQMEQVLEARQRAIERDLTLIRDDVSTIGNVLGDTVMATGVEEDKRARAVEALTKALEHLDARLTRIEQALSEQIEALAPEVWTLEPGVNVSHPRDVAR